MLSSKKVTQNALSTGRYYTLKQYSKLMRISYSTARIWANEHSIPGMFTGTNGRDYVLADMIEFNRDDYLTVSECATVYGCTPFTIHQMIAEGTLKNTIRFHGTILVHMASNNIMSITAYAKKHNIPNGTMWSRVKKQGVPHVTINNVNYINSTLACAPGAVTLSEASKQTGIPYNTLHHRVQIGTLPSLRIRGHVFVDARELRKLRKEGATRRELAVKAEA